MMQGINGPELTYMVILHPANASRFSLKVTAQPSAEQRVWNLSYVEQGTPTLITTRRVNCPSSGELWIDARTGEIVKAVLRLAGVGWEAQMTVTYKRHDRFALPLPAEMRERCTVGSAWVEGVCTYTNYRRFETGARLLPPK